MFSRIKIIAKRYIGLSHSTDDMPEEGIGANVKDNAPLPDDRADRREAKPRAIKQRNDIEQQTTSPPPPPTEESKSDTGVSWTLGLQDRIRSSLIEAAANLLPADTEQNFQTVLALCIPGATRGEPDFQNLLGVLYNNPHSTRYDPTAAHTYFLKAANSGFGPAAYNLATGWASGTYGNIDLERARFWYAKGFEYGNEWAGVCLAQLMFQDPRASTDSAFFAAAVEVLQKSGDMEGVWAPYKMANLAVDIGPEELTTAVEGYAAIAAMGAELPPVALSKMCLALRHFLGIGVPVDYPKSFQFAETATTDNQHDINRNWLQNTVGRLQFILRGANAFEPERSAARERIQAVDAVFSHEQKGDEFDALLTYLANDAEPSHHLNDHLWARTILAQIEGSTFAKAWRACAQTLQRRLLGASRDDLSSSTHDFGFTYNARNNAGYLIPGSCVDPQRPIDASHMKRAQAPLSGLGILRGLSTTPSGDIHLQCDQPLSPQTIYFTEEDIEVALALAFGSDKPIMPSISVENIGRQDAQSTRFFIEQKLWDPEWVGHTQLGKTLYAADYWMAQIVWKQAGFYTQDEQLNREADAILQKLSLAGGAADGNAKRVMLRPHTITRTWSGTTREGLSCEIHSAALGADGANIVILSDGSEDRSRNLNDDKFSAGRAANIFTEHYNEIAKAWPLFERTRQLTILLSILKELRESGFRPSFTMQRRIDTTYHRYADGPTIPTEQRLVYKF